MALSVSTVWEVRTTGSATNGGGFNPAAPDAGTDYSQQDAAQLALTNLSCDVANFIASVAGGFTNAMVGNLVYISSNAAGWVAGFYEIVGYESPNQVELDRVPTTGGPASGGAGKVGGAQSNLGMVCAAIPAASADGANVVHVKAGTYARDTHFTNQVKLNNAGHYLNHHVVRGYNATRGDAIAPCVTLDGVNAYDVYYSNKAYIQLANVAVNGYAGGTPTYASHGFNLDTGADGNTLYRCRAVNTGAMGIRAVANGCGLDGCEVSGFGRAASSIGIGVGGNVVSLVGCHAHDGTGDAFNVWSAYPGLLAYCIGAGCTQYGLNMNYNGAIYPQAVVHCVFHGNGSHGIYASGSTSGRPGRIVNTILSNNGGYGIAAHATGKCRAILRGVAFYGNSSGQVDANTTVEESVARITLTSDPFVDAAAGDFRLTQAVSGALGTGWPGAFLSAGALTSWTGAPDLGAVQLAYPEAVADITPRIATGETRLLLSDVLNSRSAILDVTPFSYGVISASMIGGTWALGRITPEYSLDGVNWAALGSALSAAGYTRPVDLRGVRYLSFRLSTVQAGYAEVDLDVWADDSAPDPAV